MAVRPRDAVRRPQSWLRAKEGSSSVICSEINTTFGRTGEPHVLRALREQDIE
jgi:hypothetical protein